MIEENSPHVVFKELGSLRVLAFLYFFSMAAATNGVAYNNQNVFSPSSGDWKSKVKVLARLCSL